MNQLRVVVLVHESLIPPEDVDTKKLVRTDVPWITEFDVIQCLKKSGHEVEVVGVLSDLKVIRESVSKFKPHIIFNLLEEFDGDALMDQNVVSYLELLGVPYTGCNPRGLIIARDKALAKKVLTYHRIATTGSRSLKMDVF